MAACMTRSKARSGRIRLVAMRGLALNPTA